MVKNVSKWSKIAILSPKFWKGDTFMFGGEYRHNKDSKNRVFMTNAMYIRLILEGPVAVTE